MNIGAILNKLELRDTPADIESLRKVIVSLAVAGKLSNADTPQARQSLVRGLAAAKIPNGALGLIPMRMAVDEISALPDSITQSLPFVRLGSVARIEKGRTGIKRVQPGEYPLVVTAAARVACDHYDFEGAAAIVPLVSSAGHGKASLNRLHYQEGKFAVGSILAAIFSLDPTFISARFLFEYLSAFKDELLVSRMIGTANVSLSVGKLAEVPIPVVPSQVQHIVDELMLLCDRLDAARAEREAARNRLAVASLARLNAPDPETFRADARFALSVLPDLTARADQIKQLRQTILNLAVRGKLVAQDPNDESSQTLVARIKSSLKNVKAAGKLISANANSPEQATVPYEVPRNWTWLSAEELTSPGQTITYGILKPVWVSVGVPTVRVTEMKTGHIDTKSLMKCAPERANKFSKTVLRAGDLLISKDGTIGKTAFVPASLEGGNITQHILRFPISEHVNSRYIRLVIDGPPYQAMMAGETKGVALQGVNVGDFRKMLLPIPPVEEQVRIVDMVDTLTLLCEKLVGGLSADSAMRGVVLDALLQEALSAAHSRSA